MEIEEEAFAFGAELLMPETAMKRVIHEPVTLTSLARLKPIWGVSIASLVVRAMNLKIITQRQYHYLFQQLGNLV
jgi:Zn-dependent peptidase ImmA (M78 family)